MRETQNEDSGLGAQQCNVLTILLIHDFMPLTVHFSHTELYIDF